MKRLSPLSSAITERARSLIDITTSTVLHAFRDYHGMRKEIQPHQVLGAQP
jgi:hypothetical protein